jgi:hypothetical protein
MNIEKSIIMLDYFHDYFRAIYVYYVYLLKSIL